MSDLDMPMLEEEEEDEDELVDDDFQDDEGDEQDGDVDLEDMLAEELDGDGGEGDDGDDGDDGDEGEEDGEDEGEEDGDDDEEGGEGEEDVEVDEGPLSPTTGGQTEPVSATYTEGGEDAEGGVRQPVIDQGDLGPGDAAVQLTGSGGSLILPTSRSSPQMDEASGQGKEHNDNNDKNEEMDLEDDEEQNSEEEDDGDIGGDADGGEGGEDGEGGETGAEPVPDVHQQFALLLADPSVPRLPNDPSIIDVSRLTIEHRKVYNAKVMSLLTEEQLDRYVNDSLDLIHRPPLLSTSYYRLVPCSGRLAATNASGGRA